MSEPRPLFDAPRQASRLAPYWEGLRNHELRLPRCSTCDRWQWYPRGSCSDCPGADFVWEKLSPFGTVFTVTQVNRPLLPGIAEAYLTGLVVMDDAPSCRIPARFDLSGGEIIIGGRVRLVFSGEGEASYPYFVMESGS